MEKEGLGRNFPFTPLFVKGNSGGEVIHIDMDLTIAMCKSNI